jgi:uncharacterized protein (TIGR02145 family)
MRNVMLTIVLVFTYLTNFSQLPGTFKDGRDGKVYKTVKIGNQIWMAQNLAFKADSFCWAYKEDEKNVAKYGRLYNSKIAKNVCPNGWHLPSNAEWTILIDSLGGNEIAGRKLKTTTNWEHDINGNATNSSGFSALPAGFRFNNGNAFASLGIDAFFWSDAPVGSNGDWGYNLNGVDGKVRCGDYGNRTSNGFSIRCIKD